MFKTPAKPSVRYVGFESIEGGRRLRFSVKLPDHESVEITTEISDAAFAGASGISIQDAVPMAYEKIVELLATEDTLEPDKLRLTDVDVARYITRHASPQKGAYATSGVRQRSDVAA